MECTFPSHDSVHLSQGALNLGVIHGGGLLGAGFVGIALGSFMLFKLAVSSLEGQCG
jgi:hypothetical protein